jgi:integrase
MTQLRDFWKWCLSRGNIITLAEMPTFPEIKFELGYRKIITWELQESVLNKLKDISFHINEKIFFGVDMLCTYTALRPEDLRRLKEDSLDDSGWLTICNPTKLKNKFKYVRLHPDHIEEWKTLHKKYPALPAAYFFRHDKGCKANELFGINYLYK